MTEDEFVALYQQNCDEASVFTPTEKLLPEGADCAFSLELADGEPMLRGLGVVLNSWSTADNRFARAGVHIAFVQLTSGSEPVLDRLLAARALADGGPRRRPTTQQRFALMPSMEVSKWPEEESVVREVRRTITAEMETVTGSAAPIEIDERSSLTERYDGPLRAPAMPGSQRTRSKTEILQGPARPPAARGLPAIPPPPPRAALLPRGTPMPPSATKPLPVTAVQPADVSIAQSPTARSQLVVVLASLWTRVSKTLAAAAKRYPGVAARLRAIGAWLARVSAPVKARLRPVVEWLAARMSPVKARLVKQLAPVKARVADMTRAALAPRWRNARVAAIFALGIFVGVLFSSWTRSSSTPLPRTTPVALAAAQCSPDDDSLQTIAMATPEKRADKASEAVPMRLKPTIAAKSSTVATSPTGAKTRSVAVPVAAGTKASSAIAKPSTATATTPANTKPAAIEKASTTPANTKPVAIVKPVTAGTQSAAIAKPSTATTTAAKAAIANPSATNTAAKTKPPTAIAKPSTAANTKPATAVANPATAASTKPATAVAKPATATKPATAVAKVTAANTKPATAVAKPATATTAANPKPSTTATTKPATAGAPIASAAPSTKPAAKPAPAPSAATKPAAAAKAVSPSSPGVQNPKQAIAATAPATPTTVKRVKKTGCGSLDCI